MSADFGSSFSLGTDFLAQIGKIQEAAKAARVELKALRDDERAAKREGRELTSEQQTRRTELQGIVDQARAQKASQNSIRLTVDQRIKSLMDRGGSALARAQSIAAGRVSLGDVSAVGGAIERVGAGLVKRGFARTGVAVASGGAQLAQAAAGAAPAMAIATAALMLTVKAYQSSIAGQQALNQSRDASMRADYDEYLRTRHLGQSARRDAEVDKARARVLASRSASAYAMSNIVSTAWFGGDERVEAEREAAYAREIENQKLLRALTPEQQAELSLDEAIRREQASIEEYDILRRLSPRRQELLVNDALKRRQERIDLVRQQIANERQRFAESPVKMQDERLRSYYQGVVNQWDIEQNLQWNRY